MHRSPATYLLAAALAAGQQATAQTTLAPVAAPLAAPAGGAGAELPNSELPNSELPSAELPSVVATPVPAPAATPDAPVAATPEPAVQPAVAPATAETAEVQAAPTKLSFKGSPRSEARPGEYVTLAYEVEGRGTYDFEVEAPSGWTPVSKRRTVKLDGSGFVPVSFKVPDLAPVGASPDIVLRSTTPAAPAVSAVGKVVVGRRVQVGLRAPEEQQTPLDRATSFKLVVTNLGNAPDTFKVSVPGSSRQTRVSPDNLSLAPGQSGSVDVTVVPEGTVSNGYQYYADAAVQSMNDAGVQSRSRTVVVYGEVNQVGSAAPDPSIQLKFRLGADADYTMSGAESRLDFRYSVRPEIGGQLSDYVNGTLPLGELSGSDERLLPSGLSFGVGLQGGSWNAAVNLGRRGGSLSGALKLGDWRLGGAATVLLGSDTKFGLALRAKRPLPGGDLLLSGSTLFGGGGHTEFLSGAYSLNLTPDLKLALGPSLTVSGGAGRTALSFGLVQSLEWNAPNFDLKESYQGSLNGVHAFGLTGGMRQVRPFGVRGASTVQIDPTGLTWRSSALLLASPLQNLNATLGGVYQVSTLPYGSSYFSITPTLSYAFQVGGGNAALSASYTYLQPLPAPLGASQAAAVGAAFSIGSWSLAAAGSWGVAPIDGVRQTRYGAQVGVGLAIGEHDQIKANYSFDRVLDLSDRQTIEAAWAHQWSSKIESQLSYSRGAFMKSGQDPQHPESVKLTLALNDVLPSTTLRLGYGVRAEGGLFGGGPITQIISAGVGYDLGFGFKTPAPVVNLFGGRIGGELSGTLYADTNLNGARDEGEAPMPGVTLRFGDQTVTTDAAGHYALRVPTGSYAAEAIGGLPSDFDLAGRVTVTVAANAQVKQDLALASINTIEALLFDDENGNGLPDPGEIALPYASVNVTGPVTKAARADGRGMVRVSGVPVGRYTVSLDPANLPERFAVTTQPVAVELKKGERAVPIALGAALPAKAQVTTFTSGAIALMGRISQPNVLPGATVTTTLRVQGEATKITLRAFDQTVEVGGSGSDRQATFKVPGNTAPGEYDVQVTAENGSANRVLTLKVNVSAAPTASAP